MCTFFTVFGYVEVLTMLMKNGADLYAKTQPSEMYAFELALKHGQSSFATAVFYRGFSYKSPFNLRPDKRTSELMTVEHLINLARQDYWIDVSQYVRLGLKAGSYTCTGCYPNIACMQSDHSSKLILRLLLD